MGWGGGFEDGWRAEHESESREGEGKETEDGAERGGCWQIRRRVVMQCDSGRGARGGGNKGKFD